MKLRSMFVITALTAALIVGAGVWKLPPVSTGLRLLAADGEAWVRAQVAAHR